MELIVRLEDWFDERLRGIDCSSDARAYVVGVLAKYRNAEHDMSRTSVVLSFAEAKLRGSFEAYQRIGDWVLFLSSVHPQALQGYDQVVHEIGTSSYEACNRIMMGQWPVYDELAYRLPVLVTQVGRCLVHR